MAGSIHLCDACGSNISTSDQECPQCHAKNARYIAEKPNTESSKSYVPAITSLPHKKVQIDFPETSPPRVKAREIPPKKHEVAQPVSSIPKIYIIGGLIGLFIVFLAIVYSNRKPAIRQSASTQSQIPHSPKSTPTVMYQQPASIPRATQTPILVKTPELDFVGYFKRLHDAWQKQDYSNCLTAAVTLSSYQTHIGDYCLYYFADSAYKLKKLDDCCKHSKQLMSMQPESRWFSESALLLGNSLFELQRFKDASDAFSIGEQKSQNNEIKAACAIRRAQALLSANDRQAAADAFFHVFVKYARSSESIQSEANLKELAVQSIHPAQIPLDQLLDAAKSYLEAGKISQAEYLAQMAIGGDETDLLNARIKLASGKGVIAAAELERIYTQNPGKQSAASALFELAMLKINSQKLDQSTNYIDMLLKNYSASLQARKVLKNLGIQYLMDANPQEAEKWFVKLFDLAPKTDEGEYALWQMAWIAWNRQDYVSAIERFETLHNTTPKTSAYHSGSGYWLGRCYQKSGKSVDSVRIWEQVATDHSRSYYGIQALRRLNRNLESISLSIDPVFPALTDPLANPTSIFAQKACELNKLDLPEDAAIEILRSEENSNRDPSWYYRAAQLYSKANKHFEAADLLDKYFPEHLQINNSGAPKDFWAIYYPAVFKSDIEKTASELEMDPSLIMAVVRRESHFRQTVISPAGAIGLMQLMPETASELAKKMQLFPFSNDMLNRGDTNIRLGSFYLKDLINHYNGNLPAALAAYNVGKSKIKSWWEKNGRLEEDELIDTIPITTVRIFVKNVLQDMANYGLIYPRDRNQ